MKKPRAHIVICALGFALNDYENFAQIRRQNLIQQLVALSVTVKSG